MEYDEYTGKWYTIENSVCFGTSVNVLEYKTNTSRPQGVCLRCGKALRRHWWVVQTAEDDLVIGEVGNECVKHLK